MYEEKKQQFPDEKTESRPRIVSIIQRIERVAIEQNELVQILNNKCMSLHSINATVDSDVRDKEIPSTNDALGAIEQNLQIIEQNTLKLNSICKHLSLIV